MCSMEKQNMHNHRKFDKSFEDRRDRARKRDSEANKREARGWLRRVIS